MQNRLIIGALFLAACSSPVRSDLPSQPTPSAEAKAPAAPSNVASSASVDEATTEEEIPVEKEEELPRPDKLEGVTCTFRGAGAPFPTPCEPNLVRVFSKRNGVKSLAQFDAASVDVTWGLFADAGRASIHARSGGIALTGFSDLASVTFRLRRESMILPEHVWLKRDAPIKIRRGLQEGASVEVLGELIGVASIPAPILCDALAFDPVNDEPPTPAAAPALPAEEVPVTILHPKNDSLRLRDAPTGRIITTLHVTTLNTTIGPSTTNPNFSSLDLEVVDEKGSSYRVRFETEFARFDVWVDKAAVERRGTGTGMTGARGCGGSADLMGKRRRVNAHTAIRIGKTPNTPSEGIAIAKNTPISVFRESGDFLEFVAISAIRPPEGESFWIPKSAVN